MSNQNLEQLRNAILLKRLQKQINSQKAQHAASVIAPADRSRALPLSFAQQRLWFLGQLDAAASAAYHLPAGLRLRGALNQDALKAALGRVIERHEVLRTTFASIDGQPAQVIAAAAPFALVEQDLSWMAPDIRQSALDALCAAEAGAPFDLEHGPLIRGRLLCLAEDEHILLITQHHIVSDGWSIGVLVREVSALYAVFCEGRADPLPPLALQYADYASWQRGWMSDDVVQAQTGFWKSHLEGAPALLELPTDRPRPAAQSYAGGQLRFALPENLCASLRALGQRHGATLFMTMLAGWSTLLARMSGQDDVVIGTPVANRQRSETEPLIGFFVNTLALRVQAGASLTVEQLLEQVKASTLGAYDHQDLPFDYVVEALQPVRSMSHTPVFQVMLSLNNMPGDASLALAGLTIGAHEQAATTTQFDLSLSLTDTGSTIDASLTYASDLFDGATIARLASHFTTLLGAMAADSQQLVGALPLLGAAERDALTLGFNPAAAAHRDDLLIHQLFEEQAAARPHAVAAVYGEQEVSYGELNRRANRVAHYLRAIGVQPDDRVAICVERGIDMLVGVLAVLKSGAGYVPLDPAYPADRLAYTLADSAPVALLTQQSLVDALPASAVPSVLLDGGADLAAIARQPDVNPSPAFIGLKSHHLAYVIYTSGSTGMPKGVMVEHRNVTRLMDATDHWFKFNQDDVWTLFHSFAFDFSVWEIWGALLKGGRLVVVPYLTTRSPQDFYQLLCDEDVTVLNQTPSAFRQLIAAQGDSARQHQLRCVVFGGEALEVATLQPWYERAVNAATLLVNMYGITETTVHVTYRALDASDACKGGASPIGRQIPDLQLYILDPRGEPVPLGVTGEMYVGGAGVARGYLNRPELTAERFVDDRFSGREGARLYKTGDLGRWLPDGQVDYLGRNDFQVKIRGFRIELGEIEARLAACAGVQDAVVLAREDNPGDKRLVAYLVPESGATLAPAALRGELAASLAAYMVPGAFVVMDAFPLTANGKLDRKALPAPTSDAFATDAYQAPASARESALAAIWCEALGLARVGVNDNFFDVGGDSIRSIAIVAKCKEQGMALAIVDMFKAPTIAALAALLAERGDGVADELAHAGLSDADRAKLPATVEDAYPVTMLQMGMVFHNESGMEDGLYHDVATHCLVLPAWSTQTMRMVLDAMALKHPVLRTSFDLSNYSEALQLVQRAPAIPLTVTDISHLDTAAQDRLVEAFVDAERKSAFVLTEAPLLRIFIHVRGAGTVQYTLSFHHAILDGWSLASLQTEMFNEYARALETGATSLALAPLALSTKLTAARERQALQSPAHKAFWNAHLDDYVFSALPPVHADAAGVALPRCKMGQVDAGVCARLQALATELEVPMRTLLLCAHMRLLATLSGNDDVTTGLVSNVRPEQLDGDKVLGLFLNTLPLRQKLGRGSWKELVRASYAAELDVMEHRDYPYFQLHLDNGRRPYYEVMFNYINFHVYDQLGADVQATGYAQMFEATSHALEIDCSYTAANGIRIEVDAQALSGGQVERIYGYFVSILEAMASNPDQQHGDHCALSAGEQRAMLEGFNDTAADYPQDRLMHQMFEDQAASQPGACALVFDGQRVCYGDLNRRANRLANHLISLGVRPDDRVAICIERGIDMIVGLLGILKSGAAYVPLDPEYPVDRLAYMLGDSAPVALLTQASLADTLPGLGVPMMVLDATVDSAVIAAAADSNPDAAALGLEAHHMAYVLYTSGSTGLPKGVMVEHRNVRNLVQHHATLCGLTRADRVLQFASFGFDNSIAEIFPALAVGARIVLRPAHLVVPDSEFVAFLETHQITMTDLPTAFWHLWASEVREGRGRPGASLRIVLAGGEKAERRHLESWFAAEGMQGIRWINTYGPTEAAVNATTIAYDAGSALPQQDIPIGRPIANTQIHILDKFGHPVPFGVAGEIHIGGVQVTRGYLNRESLTAERFIADPFSKTEGARLYKTGDLGRWMADGSVEYMGRNDFQVKIRGFRIEIGEIEACLANCPGVREVVVLAREDNPGDKRLVAYLVAHDNATLAAADLRARLSITLADYMVPSAFVVLDAMPLNPNNKLDRKALPAPGMAAVIAREYAAPQGATELAIAGVWKELLGLEQVGRDDHFFELGGHSLMVVSLIEHLRRLGLSADVRSVFTAPTLAGMAELIGGKGAAPAVGNVPPSLIQPGSTAITPEMLPLAALTQAEIDGIVARVPGGVAAIQDIYPLAPLQKGILFHHLLESEGDPYLLRMVLSFDSRQRLDAFLGALQCVIDRHDILRTGVLWTGLREPVQLVYREARLPVRQLELSGASGALEQLLAQVDPRHLRLDLQRAPLFDAHVCQDQASGEWHLALLHHHLVSDHVTLEFIIAEVQAFIGADGATLPPSAPYRNFIAHTLSIDPAAQDAYFRKRLCDIDQPSAPFGLLDVRGNGADVREATLALSDALAARIRSSARTHGVTPAVLFHVAWAQVLGQCLGRDDVVFGTVLLGRMQGSVGADQVLGMFMNTLPVRVTLADASVADVVADTYRQLSELLEHEQASLTQAQRCSAVLAPLPLFTTLLNYRHSHQPGAAEQEAADHAWEGVRMHAYEERINYPIGMSVNDLGQAFSLSAQCDGVDPQRMAAMLGQAIEALVGALDNARQTPVATLDVLPMAERALLLSGFNDTAAAIPSQLVHQLFEARVESAPDAIALTFEGSHLSYAQLNVRANRIAHHLLAIGVKADDRVALCIERGPSMVAALLGILKAGAGYVPLDPGFPAERLAYMLGDCAPAALVSDAALAATLQSAAGLPLVLLDTDADAIAARACTNPDLAGLDASSLAYVIYTSGSTGLPKGVMLEHGSVVNFLASMTAAPGMAPSDSMLAVTTLSFDIAGLELYLPLMNGARIVLTSRDTASDAAALAQTIAQEGITVMQATPATWRMLLAGGWQGSPTLKVLCGGEALPADLAARLLACTGQLWNVYGPTETTIWSTCRRVTDTVESIGRPIANTQVYILDSRLQPVPIGASGEIFIGGAGVARGYFQRPELSAERFVADPFSATPNARMYKTGDVGCWLANGDVAYQGRNDFQVKVRGFRIELGEIEARLAACAGVREAVVMARSDNTQDPADLRLVAYLLADEGVTLAAADLRSALQENLADYMVPGAYVMLDAFPLTPNNKLDRKALPAPDQSALIQRTYSAPQGALEGAIAVIWQDLLGLAQVGRDDNFFELGGHSLMAVQVAARMRQDLDVELSLRELFNNPTLAGFAAVAAGAAHTVLAPIAAAPRDAALPLSFAQQRLWFLDQLDHSAGTAYHMPAALRLKGTLDGAALQAALDRIVARHEALRTRFVLADGDAVQVIGGADCGFALTLRDLSALAGHEQENAVAMAGADESLQPFDLAAGPLVRGQLLRLSEQEHILLVTQHHIISDAWSIGVLVRELSALYAAFSLGRADPLPALAIQYADYAAWQRGWLAGDVQQTQAAFWKSHLEGAPALLELPLDRARPALQSHAGAELHFSVPADLAAGLRALGQRHGATLFMTLMGGWAALLARMSGQDDVVIGTPVANRRRAELEGLIGFFVNTLALRVRIDSNPDVAQLLAQVKASTVAAFDHQDLPFDQVVDALQPQRSTSHTPLFQVLFSMNNTPAGSDLDLPGLTISGLAQASASTQFDLVLAMTETGATLTGSLTYASALFDCATIERLAGHFITLLRAMVADETQLVAELPLLDSAARHQLLEGFNDAAFSHATDLMMHQLFEAQAAQRPDAIALEFEQHKLCYSELNRRANQLAHHLLAMGVQADDRVAICIDRSLEMVIAVLAVLKAGAAYVPLDPAYPAERLAFMLDDSLPVALLTLDSQAGRPAARVQTVLLDSDAGAIGARSTLNPQTAISATQLAYVIYTSGSTGLPKGAMNHHAGLRNLVNTQIGLYGVTPASRVLQFVSMSFDVCISEIAVALCSGAALVVARSPALLPGPALLSTVRDFRITHVSLPTAVLAALPADADLCQVQALIVGGEAMPPALARHWGARHRLFNAYGPTEATVCTLTYECTGAFDGAVPIGRPLANTRIYILDSRGQLAPQGVTGELYLGGVQVARGYLNRPELTAERFLHDPFAGKPGARMYKTGDLARWLPDGNLAYVGRNDFQVKIRGFRIELGEIEARLAACAGVREAVVLAREDQPGDKRLVAYVVAGDDATLSADTLRAQLAEALAEHMLPSAFVFCAAFPLTPNGKLDHKALPAPAARTRSASYVAARNPVEQTLCRVWGELLKVEQVGVNDNFFDLGGHSLLLVKLHAALEAEFPGRLSISDYFKYTSIAMLADLLAQAPLATPAPALALRAEARKNRQAIAQGNRQQRANQQLRG